VKYLLPSTAHNSLLILVRSAHKITVLFITARDGKVVALKWRITVQFVLPVCIILSGFGLSRCEVVVIFGDRYGACISDFGNTIAVGIQAHIIGPGFARSGHQVPVGI